jgi:hypothetical protein
MAASQASIQALERYAAVPTASWLSSLPSHADPAQILEQFLALDLSQTSEPTLSITSLANPCWHLVDPILVQIEEIVDITIPFSQRINFEISKNPTFKILLSDGFVQCIGLTRGMFPQLSPLLTPGAKALVKAGSEVRFGVIFFNSHQNVEILGGKSPLLVEKCRSILSCASKVAIEAAPSKPPAKPHPAPVLTLVCEKEKERPRQNFLDSDGEDDAAAAFDIDNRDHKPLSISQLKSAEMSGDLDVEAQITKCGLLSIIKRGGVLNFTLEVVLADQEGILKVKVSDGLLRCFLGADTGTWLRMPETEQERAFGICRDTLLRLGPVLKIRKDSNSFILLPTETN